MLPDGDVNAPPDRALLSAIQAGAASQIARTDEFFRELQNRFDARVESLEARFQKRNEDLDVSYQGKEAELDQERQALEARRKELDDRDNTHARRATRDALA